MPSKLIKDGRAQSLQAKEFTSGEWAPPANPLRPAMVPDAFHPDNSILQNTIWRRDVSNMAPRHAERGLGGKNRHQHFPWWDPTDSSLCGGQHSSRSRVRLDGVPV